MTDAVFAVIFTSTMVLLAKMAWRFSVVQVRRSRAYC